MSFFEHGLVLSHHLKQNRPPFTPIMVDLQKGRDDRIPEERRLLVERHLMKLFRTQRDMFFRIFPVEKMRLIYREKSRGTRSCILFASQANQASRQTIDMYIQCADAISYVKDRYKMIICDTSVSKQLLVQSAREAGTNININDITCRGYIQDTDELLTIIDSVPNKIAFCYISSKNDTGAWSEPSLVTRSSCASLANRLLGRITYDCQIFLNSSFSGRGPMQIMADIIPNIFIMGATETIPKKSMKYVFCADQYTGRLYISMNCLKYDECKIIADIRLERPRPSLIEF